MWNQISAIFKWIHENVWMRGRVIRVSRHRLLTLMYTHSRVPVNITFPFLLKKKILKRRKYNHRSIFIWVCVSVCACIFVLAYQHHRINRNDVFIHTILWCASVSSTLSCSLSFHSRNFTWVQLFIYFAMRSEYAGCVLYVKFFVYTSLGYQKSNAVVSIINSRCTRSYWKWIHRHWSGYDFETNLEEHNSQFFKSRKFNEINRIVL